MNINETNAVDNQLKSAASRTANAARRAAIRESVKALDIKEVLKNNGAALGNLNDHQQHALAMEILPELIKSEFIENLKHRHRVEELLIKDQLSDKEDDEFYSLDELTEPSFLKEISVQGLKEAYECGRDIINEDELKALIERWGIYNEPS